MTDTTQAPQEPTNDASSTRPRRSSGGALGGKVIAELQEIAAELGIEGANTLRKGALIDAIKAARGETPKDAAPAASASTEKAEQPAKAEKAERPARAERGPRAEKAPKAQADKAERPQNDQGQADKAESAPAQADKAERSQGDRGRGGQQGQNKGQGNNGGGNGNGNGNGGGQDKNQAARNRQDNDGAEKGGPDKGATDKNNGGGNNGNGGGQDKNQAARNRQDDADQGDDEAGGRRRNRRGRGRSNRAAEGDVQVAEDDVLVPAAGIVDILDNYAFVRTTGYLPSENDVYVSLSMVRKWGLRRGDAVVGQVRQPREGERKEKFNPMVRVDSVNGMTLDEAKQRPEFEALTPVFPTQRLRLETDQQNVVGRLVDLFAPIGKGQRGLLVAPPASGKTSVLRQLASSVTANNPECHLMIVLVDERPEEVTEFQRSVKGEVISSTFDRPAGDHTTVAELAIERAKRLVELGHDVVVLLDGITRLGRAYNQAAAGQGRVLADGVDASALFAPKRLLGAARDLEEAGSLTIVATALVETGSRVDELILGEVKGTVTTELHLDGAAASKRLFPAIDPVASSTRRDDLLQSAEELAAARTWRRELADLESSAAVAAVLERVGSAASNAEVVRRLG